MTASALLTGSTRHRRLAPRRHDLHAPLTMVLLDHSGLADPGGPLDRGGALGPERWWPVHLRRGDLLDGDEATPLDESVRDLVEARTGRRPVGAVLTITQPRTHGYVFNPLTVHLCLRPGTEDHRPELEVVVLEVTSTPWHERHCYVVDARAGADPTGAPGPFSVGSLDHGGRLHAEVPKALHVSPFMPMQQTYHLTCSPPGGSFSLILETFEQQPDGEPTKVFEASMALRAEPLTRASMARALLRHPFPTHRVWLGIHLHAVALAAMRVPFFPHPDRAGARRGEDGARSRRKVVR